MAKKKKIDTKHLFHAVCHLNIIAVRPKPDLAEALLTQMLFGEICHVVEKKNKHWYKIKTYVDEVVGWVQTSQITLISEEIYNKYGQNYALSLEICHPTFNEEVSKSVVLGSGLPLYDGISCTLPDGKYVYNGQAAPIGGLEFSTELFVKIARRYLFSPELKGGKSPFGMDAGLFVQQVFRFFGFHLPGNVNEQYLQGDVIDFIEQSREGDIAFFFDDLGQINHAGIVIGEKRIIHVHGCVRIDKLDHFGIHNADLHKYTHKLRIIKRVINE